MTLYLKRTGCLYGVILIIYALAAAGYYGLRAVGVWSE